MLKRPCQYYNVTGKCRFGKHCKFLHNIEFQKQNPEEIENQNGSSVNTDSLSGSNSVGVVNIFDSLNISQENKNESLSKDQTYPVGVEGINICESYAKSRFCRYGDKCRFQHVMSWRQPSLASDQGNNKIDLNLANKNETKQDEVHFEELGKEEKEVKPRKRICRFFRQGYCRFGNRCNFFHPIKSPRANTELNGHILEDQKSAHNENDDKDFIPVVRLPQIMHIYNKSEITKQKLVELREVEIKQLKCRISSDKLKIIEDTEEKAKFRFLFTPTDPDWPFDVHNFDIEVTFGPDYPDQPFIVSVPFDQDLPATVRRYLEVSLQEWVENKDENSKQNGTVELLFRPFLRWMDKNMQSIVTEGLKQLRRELTAKAAGLTFISAKELRKERDLKASSEPIESSIDYAILETKDVRQPIIAYQKSMVPDEVYLGPERITEAEARYADDDSHDEDEGEVNDGSDNDEVHKRPQMSLDTERKGTEMSFRNMQIWYCTTVMMEKLRLTVQCERCKNKTDFSTPPNRVNSVACSKCNNTQLVVFRPVLAHSYSSTFGYLDVEGCTAFDVILQDCHFSMGCILCSRDILVKTFTPGKIQEIWCRGCHTKMKFAADSVKLSFITTAGVDASQYSGNVYNIAVKRKARVIKDPAIQEGKPLPDNGACKHYKKSFRWLRFPCCGKCYPCDVCHDEKEDHQMKYANRMICGFCCKEQPYAGDRPCMLCSSSLTKVRTAHWEGGKGCRDKISMSKSDERKYTSMNKTLSNKAKTMQEKNKGKKTTKLRHA